MHGLSPSVKFKVFKLGITAIRYAKNLLFFEFAIGNYIKNFEKADQQIMRNCIFLDIHPDKLEVCSAADKMRRLSTAIDV